MNKNICKVFLLSGILITLTSGMVLAAPLDANIGKELQNLQNEMQSVKEQAEQLKGQLQDNLESKCANVEARIDIRLARFENNKQRHLDNYNRLKQQITDLSDQLSAEGYDVAQLKNDLLVLDQKIKKFGSDVEVFIDKLAEARGYACGKSDGQFKATLKEARDLLAVVHSDILDIRSYYQMTIRPDIQKVREQKPNTSGSN